MDDDLRTDGFPDAVAPANGFDPFEKSVVREQHPVTDASHDTSSDDSRDHGGIYHTTKRPSVRNRTGKRAEPAKKANDEECAPRAKVARNIDERVLRATRRPQGSYIKRLTKKSVMSKAAQLWSEDESDVHVLSGRHFHHMRACF